MREIRTSGSVGARGGKPPWATQRPRTKLGAEHGSWVPGLPPLPTGLWMGTAWKLRQDKPGDGGRDVGEPY